MKYPLMFMVIAMLFMHSTNAQVQLGLDIDGEAAYDESGTSVSMPDVYTVAIGAPGSNGRKGQVRIYSWKDSVWVQKGGDILGEASSDNSGTAISMPDSNTVAIGAATNDGNGFSSGHVRVYAWVDSVWSQKGSDIDGEAASDNSGVAVSMPDPNTVAIGAYGNDGNGNSSGHIRIYSWKDSIWEQKGGDIDGEAALDGFGWAVSMSDSNTVAIGAPTNDGNGNNSGHVRVYAWKSGSWIQKGIDIDGEASGDLSGASVSMPDSNTVAIGAPKNGGNGVDAGHVRIYSWNGKMWLQKGVDIDGEAAGDEAGWSVSMPDANTVAIGAMYNDGRLMDAGSVHIYSWYGNVWIKRGNDIDGEYLFDQSGSGVSMPDANTVAVGAMYHDVVGAKYKAGDVRIYNLCTTASNADLTACNKFTSFSGNSVWDTSGVYVDTVYGYGNCYDVVTINLTIDTVDVSVSQNLASFSANAVGASFQWFHCNNEMAILQGDTNRTFTATVNGSYAVEVTQNGCVDTSACFDINNVGLEEALFQNSLSVYPNPTSNDVTIEMANFANSIDVVVRNIHGQHVSLQSFKNTNELKVLMPAEAGVYLLEVHSMNKIAILKVVKE